MSGILRHRLIHGTMQPQIGGQQMGRKKKKKRHPCKLSLRAEPCLQSIFWEGGDQVQNIVRVISVSEGCHKDARPENDLQVKVRLHVLWDVFAKYFANKARFAKDVQ